MEEIWKDVIGYEGIPYQQKLKSFNRLNMKGVSEDSRLN